MITSPWKANEYPDTGRWMELESVSATPGTPKADKLALFTTDALSWLQKDSAGLVSGLLSIASPGGNAGEVPFFSDDYQIDNSADFTYSITNGLVGNDTGGSAVDLRWETNTIDHALFIDASADTVNFGSDNATTGATFLSSYYTAANDAATIRAVKFWSVGNQTATGSKLHVGFEARLFYTIDSGHENTDSNNGLITANILGYLDASASAGTIDRWETLRVEAGIIGTGNSPTVKNFDAIRALTTVNAGTVETLINFSAGNITGSGTANLSVAYYANPFIGTETYGFLAQSAISQAWQWTTLNVGTGTLAHLDIGDGVNYSLTFAGGGPTVRGVRHSAGITNTDGRYIEIYNPSGSGQTITFNHNDGSGTAGERIFTRDGNPIALAPGDLMGMKYHPTEDSNNGAWLAWVN